MDFVKLSEKHNKNAIELEFKFNTRQSSDLMIKNNDFYAWWNEDEQLWSTDENNLLVKLDGQMSNYYNDRKKDLNDSFFTMKPLWDGDSGAIEKWNRLIHTQMRNNYHDLDQTLIFSNQEGRKKDYASKRLPYPLEEGDTSAWDTIMSVLYSEEERHKIEWAIGSVVNGDSKKLQKFLVFYGAAGTGKSTVLNIIQKLFDGYWTVFDAKSLGDPKQNFAFEPFRNKPLVGIQHDGDLSRIEDNTRLNSLVSHEEVLMNEKNVKSYPTRLYSFLFMGTNKPVKITDAKSGLTRRLIDVSPTGEKLSPKEYKRVMKQIDFELGAIAYHCKQVYETDPDYYDTYVPLNMMSATNDFYNFMLDNYHIFVDDEGVSLNAAWEMYKEYVEDAKIPYPMSKRIFKEEFKNYFYSFEERITINGDRKRNWYSGLKKSKFESDTLLGEEMPEKNIKTIEFLDQPSIFDKECAGCLSQYSTKEGTPRRKWDNVVTRLKDIDTSKLHYVKVPENHIVIDFDIPNEKGEKDFMKNLEEASKWPPTYAELSKSGSGIHLHYIYTGDVEKLSRVYDDKIEVKIFNGNSSLRRMLTKCNNLPIAKINSGLPLKGDTKVINTSAVTNEKGIRTLIKRNLNKEYHPGTKPSIDFIFKILEDAYNSGIAYDVTDLRNAVTAFAVHSSHQSDYCMKLVGKMHFKSDVEPEPEVANKNEFVFYDVEVFENLLVIDYKMRGKPTVIRMINPKPSEVEELMQYNLIGFNCRKYDNHIIYARGMLGYDNEQLYKLSQDIIVNGKGFFGQAYNISYTDIYDYSSKKQSLKKWEIELAKKWTKDHPNSIEKNPYIHLELGLPWDKPVPEELWTKVAEYCENDVIATEGVFEVTQGDFVAREMLVATVKGLHPDINVCVNDTTNTLTTKLVFGSNRHPQNEFNYRDLSKPVGSDEYSKYKELFGWDYNFRVFDPDGRPCYRDYIPGESLPVGYSILPFFPGYKFDNHAPKGEKSYYLDDYVGEGGKVYAKYGFWGNVRTHDVASMHPHSVIFECLFGPRYTKIFKEIVQARVYIKHGDFESAGGLLSGALQPFLKDKNQAKALAQALKIAINSIYGLTSAAFDNPFRDIRNIDNIVAKRGALFMSMLKREVENQCYNVVHIKTDSIKVSDVTNYITEFISKFGAEYGYTFEIEDEYEKMCLVNDAVYIAKRSKNSPEIDEGLWTATGAQFAVPYVFKKLFSGDQIVFDDYCETKSVSKGALYLDMNENLPDDQHDYHFVGRVGQFTPIKSGCGGGVLYRMDNNKYNAAAGTKGFRWMESEMVRNLDKIKDIDGSYHEKLCNDAVDSINKYVDFEWFRSDDPYIAPLDIHSDVLPF